MNQRRKIGTLLLALTLVISSFIIPGSTFAAQNEDNSITMAAQSTSSGKVWSNNKEFKWTQKNGTLKINGKGSFTLNLDDFLHIRNKVKKIEFSKGITAVNFSMLSFTSEGNGFPNLTQLTLPSSLTTLDGELSGCSNLETVTGGINLQKISSEYRFLANTKFIQKNGLICIGKVCIAYNGSESHITIPSSIKTVLSQAFARNRNLEEVTIPSSVTTLGSSAFTHCSSLATVRGGENVTSVTENTFAYTPWQENQKGHLIFGKTFIKYRGSDSSYTVPANLTSIADSAFENCKTLEKITIKGAIKTVPWYAFAHCDKLNSITLPKSVTTISYGAFDHCKALKKIALPTNLNKIEQGAFIHCTDLSEVTVSGGANNSRLKSIGSYAFAGCKKLKNLTIPKGVTSINKKAYGYNVSDDYALTSTKIKDAKITGVKRTKAETYAKNNKITFKSIADNGKWINGLSQIAPTLTAKKKNGKHILSFSKVAGATGYQIYHGFGNNSNSFQKLETLNASNRSLTLSWDNTVPRSYYKVRAYRKTGSTTVYGPFSTVKSLK